MVFQCCSAVGYAYGDRNRRGEDDDVKDERRTFAEMRNILCQDGIGANPFVDAGKGGIGEVGRERVVNEFMTLSGLSFSHSGG